jgi:hypothetical protein
MPYKKGKKELDGLRLARIKKEMAKPRMAKSARMAKRNLDTNANFRTVANGTTPD